MAINIPKVQTTDRQVNQLQQNVSNSLAPITKNPQAQGLLLKSVSLTTGSNTINTNLDRALQGWQIVRMRSNYAQVYDNQDNNSNPTQTLVLVSSANVSVDIYVF